MVVPLILCWAQTLSVVVASIAVSPFEFYRIMDFLFEMGRQFVLQVIWFAPGGRGRKFFKLENLQGPLYVGVSGILGVYFYFREGCILEVKGFWKERRIGFL